MRSQRCRGIPTVGGQADWLSVSVFVSDKEKNVEMFSLVRENFWLDTLPRDGFLLPLLPSLCLSLFTLPTPAKIEPFVKVYVRNSAPNANQTSNHPPSPEPVCDFSTLLCFWSLTPDCSPHTAGDNANYILFFFTLRKEGTPDNC